MGSYLESSPVKVNKAISDEVNKTVSTAIGECLPFLSEDNEANFLDDVTSESMTSSMIRKKKILNRPPVAPPKPPKKLQKTQKSDSRTSIFQTTAGKMATSAICITFEDSPSDVTSSVRSSSDFS